MTLTEMSNEFDILYNNIMSNQAPGLDEYEKSLFLTKAQNELILEYFNPKGNKFQEGFDGSERRQIDFSKLIVTYNLSIYDGDYTYKRDNRSIVFKLSSTQKDVLLIINEFLRLDREAEEYTDTVDGHSVSITAVQAASKILTVVPVNYIEYARLMSKPYKLPVKSQAWRLMNSTEGQKTVGTGNEAQPEDDFGTFSEILYNTSAYKYKGKIKNEDVYTSADDPNPHEFTPTYSVTYIKRPSPIVLIDLADAYSDVSIEGVINATPCSLDPIMHHDIVQRAVELAKAAYTGDLSTQIQVGNASATDLGIIPNNSRRER